MVDMIEREKGTRGKEEQGRGIKNREWHQGIRGKAELQNRVLLVLLLPKSGGKERAGTEEEEEEADAELELGLNVR